MNLTLPALISGHLLLLAFVSAANPRKANVTANRWLSFLFLSSAFAFASPLVTDDAIARILELSRFAMAPALYLGVLYFTSPGKRFQSADLVHFVPAALFAVFAQTFIIPQAFKLGLEQLVWNTIHINPGFLVFASLIIQNIVYWILSWVRLLHHQRNVRLFASANRSVNLWWLQYMLIGLALIVILWINANIFPITVINAIAPYGHLFAIYFIAYFSLKQQEVFPFDKRSVIEIKDIILEQEIVSASKPLRILPEHFAALKLTLEKLMIVERLFLNPTLSLPELATRLDITSHQLSYLINEGFNENFYQFVNRYRVDEAKRLLRSDTHHHLNMLGIAFESGFNSKTTFNTMFKKLEGLSPSRYSQMQRDQKSFSPLAVVEEGCVVSRSNSSAH